MSRGPGRIERAIEHLFNQHPHAQFTVAGLARLAYRLPADDVRRSHLVATRRAAGRVADRLGWRTFGKPHSMIYYDPRYGEPGALPGDDFDAARDRFEAKNFLRDLRQAAARSNRVRHGTKLRASNMLWPDALFHVLGWPNTPTSRADLAATIETLPACDRAAIEAYADHRLRKDVGKALGCSERQGGRILDAALLRLRAALLASD